MRPVSPSQIVKFAPRTGCPRAWAGRYIFGIKEPDSPHAEFGTRIHTVHEDYVERGVKPDPADEAALRFIPALPYCAKPYEGQCEFQFTITLGGVEYTGALDHLMLDPDGVPHVRDLKSTKNPKKKWQGKRHGLDTREDFLVDPQWLVYAIVAMVKYKTQRVRGTWIYIATEGAPYAEPRKIECTRAEILTAFNRHVQRWAVPLVQIRARKPTNLLQVTPNAAHCDRYRSMSRDPAKRAAAPGCRLRDRCTDVSDADRALAALGDMAKDEDELIEELRREQRDPGINGPVRKGKGKAVEVEDDEDEDVPAPRSKASKRAPEPEDDEDELPAPKKGTRAETEDDEDEELPPAKPSKGTTKKQANDEYFEREAKQAAKSEALDKSGAALRDMFAIGALQVAQASCGSNASAAMLAGTAYALADAMLAARKA